MRGVRKEKTPTKVSRVYELCISITEFRPADRFHILPVESRFKDKLGQFNLYLLMLCQINPIMPCNNDFRPYTTAMCDVIVLKPSNIARRYILSWFLSVVLSDFSC